ncbi:Pc16g14630 [Penicillium rubens Wisconsin 54-1255]|uniref:Pc16g14630 protein n=1 Tax=Penicillium rubens (strain ATCC 28089 / DSM 1075 / NRRL 1951 / Wisconsin 54-1255) TaxID=500485 RepID=B6HA09_PENRW|nr:Pc16g14630 [Penicillium rubens Wisconsin 54-1255]
MPSLEDHSSSKPREDQEQSIRPEEDPQQGLLFHQVYEWLHHEKTRRQNRKARKAEATSHATNGNESNEEDGVLERPSSNTSNTSESTFSLDKLEKILLQYATTRPRSAMGLPHKQPVKRQSRHRLKGLRRGSASESELTDVDGAPPSVEAFLDNTKTLAYTGGAAVEENPDSSASVKQAKDAEAWVVFKSEIVRLAHTLQLKGWRRVTAELAGDIEVVRLSGALTNAVYVVGPPKNMPPSKSDSNSLVSRKPPPKLLLRIYGPQVDHLIDRENELQILRRLGKKNIGPRILGTFMNGRFEEYFEARPLTPRELRMPETARQVAKRMRELHDGVELLEEEREGGPMIFKNWDKWVDRCEQVTTWLDKEIQSPQNEAKAALEPWRRRGYVCGVTWDVFRKAVENYRRWLVATSGGTTEIKRQLVFAHNDTQYGNLLRMEPATESPLLLPANEHKQLIVIDFEYSSANTRGLEFANHFTEWCYNYHDEERSWACNNRNYPTSEQQYQFVSTYLTHRPHSTGGPISPLSSPTIHARAPVAVAPLDLDEGSDRPTWGIVQAKVPGMEEGIAEMLAARNGPSENGNGDDTKTPPVDAEIEEDEGDFDYLAYAQDRVMFFWGDLLSLNLIKPEELPAPLLEHVKSRLVAY